MKTKENNSNMKIKDYFEPGVFILSINKFYLAPYFKGLCKNGIIIEVILIDSKFYCSISAYIDDTKGPRLHLAMFPVKSSYTSRQVFDLAIWLLDDMGYIKHVKK